LVSSVTKFGKELKALLKHLDAYLLEEALAWARECYKAILEGVDRVIAEIKYLQEKTGAKEIAFYDDSFTLDKKRAHAIAEK
jgi:hypothetical protein